MSAGLGAELRSARMGDRTRIPMGAVIVEVAARRGRGGGPDDGEFTTLDGVLVSPDRTRVDIDGDAFVVRGGSSKRCC